MISIASPTNGTCHCIGSINIWCILPKICHWVIKNLGIIILSIDIHSPIRRNPSSWAFCKRIEWPGHSNTNHGHLPNDHPQIRPLCLQFLRLHLLGFFRDRRCASHGARNSKTRRDGCVGQGVSVKLTLKWPEKAAQVARDTYGQLKVRTQGFLAQWSETKPEALKLVGFPFVNYYLWWSSITQDCPSLTTKSCGDPNFP